MRIQQLIFERFIIEYNVAANNKFVNTVVVNPTQFNTIYGLNKYAAGTYSIVVLAVLSIGVYDISSFLRSFISSVSFLACKFK